MATEESEKTHHLFNAQGTVEMPQRRIVHRWRKGIMAKRHNSTRPRIPEFDPSSTEYDKVYQKILDTVDARNAACKPPERVVVITDLAKDFDDLLAMIVLKELHRLRAVELLGFVANLNPAKERARLGRGALNRLGLQGIPIAIGSVGDRSNHEVLDYEFAGSESFTRDVKDEDLKDGQQLLFDIFTKAKQEGYTVTLLAISSLMDIAEFAKVHHELLKDTLGKCVLQGGYSVIDNQLQADIAATNNHFAFEEAQYFHKFLQENKIPSICFTKVATFATPIYQTLLIQMEKTKIDVGQYLRAVQLGQDLYFWKCASGPVEGRFRPFMDEQWFLKNKTTWYDKHPPGEPGPKGDDIIPWLDKVTAYDCLAAIGAAGDDILEALGVIAELKVRTDAEHTIHRSVGVLPVMDPEVKGKILRPEEANIHGHVFANAIQALALGSLRIVAQDLLRKEEEGTEKVY